MASLWTWMPNSTELMRDLAYDRGQLMVDTDCAFQGMKMRNCVVTPFNQVIGAWPYRLSQHWWFALSAAVFYLVGVVALKAFIAYNGKVDVKWFAYRWNIFLSLFSFAGVFSCAPVLIEALMSHGLYFATCAKAEWYGLSISGVFILFFVLSKFAEFVDTALLILSDKPVILLHWWHHVSVMLYCWHSYCCRISTGIWFATINYFVHSLMYGYFALTQTKYRKHIFPYAVYITLLQLTQMLIGMWITIKAVQYQIEGRECHVNRTNSFLGLTMYFSYFVLFGKLFIDHYCLGKKIPMRDRTKPESAAASSAQPNLTKQRSALRTMSSKIIQSIEDEEDSDSEQKDSKGKKKD